MKTSLRMALGLCPILAALAGCSGGDRHPHLQVGAAPANGMQVVLPIVKDIQPGTDNEYCTWMDVVDRELDIRAIDAVQTETGHHVGLLATQKLQPPGTTRPCTEEDMATFNFVAVAGAGEGGTRTEAPGELVFRVPAGAQLVFNHHYLNATTRVMEAQSAMNIHFAEPGRPYLRSASVSLMHSKMQLPAGTPTLAFTCTFERDFRAWFVAPHMHEWGTRITVDHASGGNTERLFDVAWLPQYVFHPPELVREPATAYAFRAGDTVRVGCAWETPEAMTFGKEMCVTFVQVVDEANEGANWLCDDGAWRTF